MHFDVIEASGTIVWRGPGLCLTARESDMNLVVDTCIPGAANQQLGFNSDTRRLELTGSEPLMVISPDENPIRTLTLTFHLGARERRWKCCFPGLRWRR